MMFFSSNEPFATFDLKPRKLKGLINDERCRSAVAHAR